MSGSYWREESCRVLCELYRAHPSPKTLTEWRRLVQNAYPFGARAHHPYRCWLREVTAFLVAPEAYVRAATTCGPLALVPVDPRQLDLLGGEK